MFSLCLGTKTQQNIQTLFVVVIVSVFGCQQCTIQKMITQLDVCFISFSLCLILIKSSKDKIDYAELLFTPKHPSPNISLQQHGFVNPSMNHPQSQDDIPPALPYRPNNMVNSAVSPPNVTKMSAESNRLYPSLDHEFTNIPSSLPVQVTKKFTNCLVWKKCLIVRLWWPGLSYWNLIRKLWFCSVLVNLIKVTLKLISVIEHSNRSARDTRI